MFSQMCLTVLLLVLTVVANPVVLNKPIVTLPISRRVNVTNIHHIIRNDQLRASMFKLRGAAKASGFPFSRLSISNTVASDPCSQIENQAVAYVASVEIGSPPTSYELLVDTGSSNTWIGAGKVYVKTSTSVQTSNRVAVTYGSGSFSGTEFTDTVSFGTGLTINKQSIGVAATSEGFEGFDGVLGLGPDVLTEDTLSPATTSTIPTVTDNLFTQGDILERGISISFEPSISGNDLNGEIGWGGTDSTKFTGSITAIPITTTAPSSEFWGIDQSIRYGASTNILSTTAGIVDTGTTLILLSTNGFNAYQKATGAVPDNNTGLLRLTSAQFSNLQSLFFTAGGTIFEFTPNAQIWPRALNTDIGGVAGSIYLVTNSLGTPSGEGLDFINGFTFIERFYTVFDTTNNFVGLATTPFTTATTN